MTVYWIWLATRQNCGAAVCRQLLDVFGTPESIWKARREEISAVPSMTHSRVDALMHKDLTRANDIMEVCLRKNITIVTAADNEYPAPLRALPDAPVVLYVRGSLPDFASHLAISIVGTRHATQYGLQAARYFAGNLAQNDCIIVSGMARGIDGEANRAAIDAGGVTIAVLGCGADVCYPWQHQRLMDDIIRTGAVITEYPPGTDPHGWHFPARNRIMTGLSRGTLVVEAPQKSGALISADLALEQGRDVFAVPGNINRPNSAGCNALIRQGGAELVQTPSDILAYYEHEMVAAPAERVWTQPVSQEEPPQHHASAKTMRTLQGTQTERIVWRAVRGGHHTVDTIVEDTGLPAAQVLSALTMLEVGSYVIRSDTGYRAADDVQQ